MGRCRSLHRGECCSCSFVVFFSTVILDIEGRDDIQTLLVQLAPGAHNGVKRRRRTSCSGKKARSEEFPIISFFPFRVTSRAGEKCTYGL